MVEITSKLVFVEMREVRDFKQNEEIEKKIISTPKYCLLGWKRVKIIATDK